MNEVDVCYLNSKGEFESRKTETYNTFDQAREIFIRTVKKFRSSGTSALVTLRRLQNKTWILEKAERT